VFVCYHRFPCLTLSILCFPAARAFCSDDIRRQQLEEDEALARRLQRQESSRLSLWFFCFSLELTFYPSFLPFPFLALANRMMMFNPQMSQDLQSRLREVIETMPLTDPRRPFLMRIHQSLVSAVSFLVLFPFMCLIPQFFSLSVSSLSFLDLQTSSGDRSSFANLLMSLNPSHVEVCRSLALFRFAHYVRSSLCLVVVRR
jgi:hypothetical protein